MIENQVAILVISLVLSALFSGIEIAFISANKLHMQLQSKQGTLSGRILSKFMKSPARFIGTTLVGNNLALVVYGIFMANLFEPILTQNLPGLINSQPVIFVLQTLIATIIILVTAEFTPKSFFLLNPDRLISIFALPMLLFYYLLYPLVYVIVTLSKFTIIYIFRLEYSENKPVFGLTDLNHYLTNFLEGEHESDVEAEVNTKILTNALEFKTVRIRECMIPRTEMIAVDIEDEISTLQKAFSQSGHSKILVFKGNIDEVIGYCNSLELFRKPKRIEDILTHIIIVPETMPANELMIQFINEHKNLALVVDEFGGTSGIVTMEDIIEEIFGEIQDEHDTEDLVEQQIDGSTFVLSARLEIDYLNDKYGWKIPEGDYETLGGYILSETENIPKVNDTIDIAPFRITIITMQDARIDKIRLILNSNVEK